MQRRMNFLRANDENYDAQVFDYLLCPVTRLEASMNLE